jgi:hypothetical protein
MSASGQELLSLHLTFSAKRGGEVSLVAKPMGTDGEAFQPQTIPTHLAALQRQKQVLQAQYMAVSGPARTIAKPEFDRQMAAADAKIAHYRELENVCQELQGGGAIHFRVFMDVGGRQIDLLTTKGDERAAADPAAISSEGDEETDQQPPAAKETAEG